MSSTSQRKTEHFEIALRPEMYHIADSGLDDYNFDYCALFEHSLESVSTETEIFGIKLNYPIIIGSMTGGAASTAAFTHAAARCAAHFGFGFGLGSCRAIAENPDLIETYGLTACRSDIPLVIGNIGISQLACDPVYMHKLSPILEEMGVHAIYCHLNILQEYLQPEGDRCFDGASAAIRNLAQSYPHPVIIKEVGNGISGECATRLRNLGVLHLETAGLGGTSWVAIEAERCRQRGDFARAAIAESLIRLGIPTASAIVQCRNALGQNGTVIGSGGIRTALDIAKALALGANAVAIARPFLVAWHERGEQGLFEYAESLTVGLRIIMATLDCPDINHLYHQKLQKIR